MGGRRARQQQFQSRAQRRGAADCGDDGEPADAGAEASRCQYRDEHCSTSGFGRPESIGHRQGYLVWNRAAMADKPIGDDVVDIHQPAALAYLQRHHDQAHQQSGSPNRRRPPTRHAIAVAQSDPEYDSTDRQEAESPPLPRCSPQSDPPSRHRWRSSFRPPATGSRSPAERTLRTRRGKDRCSVVLGQVTTIGWMEPCEYW